MDGEIVCRTCFRSASIVPDGKLVNEGGLMFCLRCLRNYRFLMAWMKGEQPEWPAEED